MAENYPLVEQREYARAGKRGGFLSRRVARDDEELPRVAAHHVRVFRVGEEYVEDHGQLRSDDRTVVEASSVTVVDRRVEVPVVVETRIPSAEAAATSPYGPPSTAPSPTRARSCATGSPTWRRCS